MRSENCDAALGPFFGHLLRIHHSHKESTMTHSITQGTHVCPQCGDRLSNYSGVGDELFNHMRWHEVQSIEQAERAALGPIKLSR
jgi:hypothetical protein